jgi:hypothetical protein
MLSAVFYGQLGGGTDRLSGTARAMHYAAAYSIALGVTVAVSLSALALAVRDVRAEARD